MVLEGVVRGGVIVPEGEPPPEGTRVRYHPVVVPDDDEDDFGPPPPRTETREEFLASLRESVAEARAGVRGMTLDEVMERVSRENNLPWPPAE